MCRLGRLEEDSMPAQALDMHLVAMVHIEMASTKVTKDVGVDLISPVPHRRIHKRIDRDCGPHLDWTFD